MKTPTEHKFTDLPVEPGKRKYRMFQKTGPAPDDWEEHWIDEAELTFEQKKALATELINQFCYMPDDVQDMFNNWQDALISHGQKMIEQGKIIPLNSPLITPGKS